ncbi:MAG: UDP-N-acetylglucosamine 2-epimerase [Bacteroidetes bacterium]|nr:UDP-N-acetylglucosamine 2-epimerase [Bacteroidota bacterium]
MKKALTVVGARPQFIKLSPVARAFEGRFAHVIVHTGQHYDDAMSRVFFEDLVLPRPDYNLGVGSGTHAMQTGSMMTELEPLILAEKPDVVVVYGDTKPDVVVVYGDTNSTLAGALVAAKLNIPVAHIEAGLRSFNREMPEEINRIVTDRVSQFLFCPTETALQNLSREGMGVSSKLVGDVMLDALLLHEHLIPHHHSVLTRLNIQPRGYYLATVHRASNTDNAENLRTIIDAIDTLDSPVILPLHPRTRSFMELHKVHFAERHNIRFIEPVGYLDMLALQSHAKKVLTDSGGIQKEAYCLGTPCVTLRTETEWTETLEGGWNILAGVDKHAIVDAAGVLPFGKPQRDRYGKGDASRLIADVLGENLP